MTTVLNFTQAHKRQDDQTYLDILAQQEAERQKAGAEADLTRTELVEKFMKNNISLVRVEFAGSGDSGTIESIDITCGDNVDRNEEFNQSADGKKPAWGSFFGFKQEIEDWAYTFIEGCGVDWYNNEGGQGYIEFDMTNVPFKFECNIDVNITTSESAYYTQEIA